MTDDDIFDLVNEQKELREERKILNIKLEKTPILVKNLCPHGNSITPDHISLEKWPHGKTLSAASSKFKVNF
jgi:hypothetical protein